MNELDLASEDKLKLSSESDDKNAQPQSDKVEISGKPEREDLLDQEQCEDSKETREKEDKKIDDKNEENLNDIKESKNPFREETDENKITPLVTPDASSTVPACIIAADGSRDHISYTEEGDVIYTDPKTKLKQKWCTHATKWLPFEENTVNTIDNPYENEHYKWCTKTNQWILKDKASTPETQTETEFYRWDAEKNEWIPKEQPKSASSEVTYDTDEDGQRIYTDKDGVVFFWDAKKSAWFPRIDDEFMARYQMNYGFIDNTSSDDVKSPDDNVKTSKDTESALNTKDPTSTGIKRKLPKEPPKWFEITPEQNTKVYVSNLPLDITLDEFSEIMSKCGMIMRDPKTQKYKLKLYTENDGQVKGDGLCDYIKVESVELALSILDDYEVRGQKIKVQRATFQMRGEYNPALKPKRPKKEKEKLQKIKEKLFDWRPEKMRGERSKNEKTVIITNLFTPELFDKEVHLIIDYQKDLREECSKCGTVRKVVIYDRHPEGVAQINMSSPEEADVVIQMMNGRFFGKRKLTAHHWDGKTKYKIFENETEVQKRLHNWDRFLDEDEKKNSTEQCYIEGKQKEVIDSSDDPA